MSLISVILPTYNRKESTLRAANSVLNQTHRKLELIVVDDGSSEDIHRDLDQLNDPRIKLLRQNNQGVSRARNSGIQNSRGDFISLLDSDDIWKPDKLQKQIQFMRDAGWDIAQTREIWIRKGRKVNPKTKHTKKAGWIFAPSLKLCLVSPSCVMLTRQCWENIGPFDPHMPACEDYDLWLRCSLYYPVGLVPEELVYKYGGHPDQLSRKILGLDMYRIYSLCKLLSRYRLTTEQRQQTCNELSIKLRIYMQGCLKNGNIEEAQRIQDYVRTSLNHPIDKV